MNQTYDMEMKREKIHHPQNKTGGGMALDTFGKRLRVLRIDRDLSQIDLRDKMVNAGTPIGETYISELERTEKMPSLEVAAAMARALDVSVDYLALLIDDAVSYRRQPMPDNYYSEEADDVARMVDSMRPEQRLLVLNIVKSMVNAPSQRQRERIEIIDMLDSIERQRGRAVRREIEQILRSRGIPIDPAS